MSYPTVNLIERLEADLCFGLTCGQTVSLFWKMIFKAPIKSLGYANREQWVFPRVTGLIAWHSGTKLYCIMMKNVFHSFCGKSLISVWIGFLLGKNDFFLFFCFFWNACEFSRHVLCIYCDLSLWQFDVLKRDSEDGGRAWLQKQLRLFTSHSLSRNGWPRLGESTGAEFLAFDGFMWRL